MLLKDNTMDDSKRRPLKVRETDLAQSTAKKLSEKDITPNMISLLSIFFSLIAGVSLAFVNSTSSISINIFLLFIVAFGIQMRLLCNLFDGMVAVEGNKFTKSGELYNDIPDRISDAIIFIGLGYSISHIPFAIELGYLTAIFAILTAYIRVLNITMGSYPDFQGPMAKQHRMALLTFSSLLCVLSFFIIGDADTLLLVTLLVILLGSILTSWKRIYSAYNYLEKDKN